MSHDLFFGGNFTGNEPKMTFCRPRIEFPTEESHNKMSWQYTLSRILTVEIWPIIYGSAGFKSRKSIFNCAFLSRVRCQYRNNIYL